MEEKIKQLFIDIFYDIDLSEDNAEMLKKHEQELLKEAKKLALNIPVVSGSLLNIEFEDWNYTCGDGCCTTFGCDVYLNGEKLDEQHADDHINVLNAILPKLGYKVDINYR